MRGEAPKEDKSMQIKLITNRPTKLIQKNIKIIVTTKIPPKLAKN